MGVIGMQPTVDTPAPGPVTGRPIDRHLSGLSAEAVPVGHANSMTRIPAVTPASTRPCAVRLTGDPPESQVECVHSKRPLQPAQRRLERVRANRGAAGKRIL